MLFITPELMKLCNFPGAVPKGCHPEWNPVPGRTDRGEGSQKR